MADFVLDPHFEVTEEEVRERIFDNIEVMFPANAQPDFREGGPIWTMTSPSAKEVVSFYLDLNEVLNISFLQYTYGIYLDAKGMEIGLDRIQAAPGKGIVRFLGDDGVLIPAGTTVSTTAEDADDVAYQIDTDTYEEDGVTVIPAADRTIRGIPDPVAANAVQRITFSTLPTGGSFTLDFNGEVTAPINFNDTALDVQVAIEALPGVAFYGGDSIEASGGPFPFSDIVVEFKNGLGKQDVPLLLVDGTFGGFDGVIDITMETKGTTALAAVNPINAGTGAITGDAQWKYTWVTRLGDEREDDAVYEEGYGESAGSPATEPVTTLADEDVEITVEEVPSFTGLQEITQVRLYRSFNDGGGFSDFKLVAVADVPTVPGPITLVDNVPNADFEVEQVTLTDDNTTGVVDIPSTAILSGAATNIPVRAVSLLDDSVFGVAEVTNPSVFAGGDDTESDDDYRERLLEEVRKPAGAGNVADYIGWAKEIAGVGGVTVVPEWEEQFGYPNGPGTVKVVLSGPSNEVVNYDLIETVRKHIAGTIALDAPRDFLTYPYAWSATVNPGAGIGAEEYTIAEDRVGTLLQNEEQILTGNAAVYGGTFTLGFRGSEAAPIPVETTAPIAWDADATTIQTELEALASVAPGDIVVSGGPINQFPVVLEFDGANALTDMQNLVVDSSLLVSGLNENLNADGYEYVFSFVNVGGGETPHSAANEDFTTDPIDDAKVLQTGPIAEGDTVTINDVPDGPTGVDVQNTVKRRVYRRNSGSTDDNFYLVGEVIGNDVEDFVDNVAEDDLGLRYAPVVNSTSLFDGKAPIGAHVTVESISEFAVLVHATIIPRPGYNLLGTGGNINLGNILRNELKTFFDGLAAGEVLYYIDVQNVLHDAPGVLDHRDVYLETAATGLVQNNIIPPNQNAKPVYNNTGVLVEAAS